MISGRCIFKCLFWGSVVLGLIIWATACQVHFASGPNPEITMVEGSDPLPAALRQHIILRTDQFCREEGYSGVRHLTVYYRASEQNTEVLYSCIGEDTQTGPRRGIEEVLSRTKEIHYCTVALMVYHHCTFEFKENMGIDRHTHPMV